MGQTFAIVDKLWRLVYGTVDCTGIQRDAHHLPASSQPRNLPSERSVSFPNGSPAPRAVAQAGPELPCKRDTFVFQGFTQVCTPTRKLDCYRNGRWVSRAREPAHENFCRSSIREEPVRALGAELDFVPQLNEAGRRSARHPAEATATVTVKSGVSHSAGDASASSRFAFEVSTEAQTRRSI